MDKLGWTGERCSCGQYPNVCAAWGHNKRMLKPHTPLPGLQLRIASVSVDRHFDNDFVLLNIVTDNESESYVLKIGSGQVELSWNTSQDILVSEGKR